MTEMGAVLWLGTGNGLSRFDTHTETFKNYDVSDGLQGNEFIMRLCLQEPAMASCFSAASMDSMPSIRPISRTIPYVPPVVITDFQLANKPVAIGEDSVLQKSIVETEDLVLSHEDRVISFEFAALNYSSPEKNRYRYKLEGFDEEWTEVGSDRRFVTYTNLDPGDYVFRVLGSNNDGVWNEKGTSLAITITPPWWQTWWFRGGVIVLLVGLVAGGFVWQRASARRRERQLEAQVAERTYELGERVKELDCLYGISSLAGQADISLGGDPARDGRPPAACAAIPRGRLCPPRPGWAGIQNGQLPANPLAVERTHRCSPAARRSGGGRLPGRDAGSG